MLEQTTTLFKNWYHLTTLPNWFNEAQSFPNGVHVGTKQAAIERARALLYYYDKREMVMNLHRVRVKSLPGFINATNQFRDGSETTTDHYINASVLYTNVVEDPGSSSLLIAAKYLKHCETTTYTFAIEPRSNILVAAKTPGKELTPTGKPHTWENQLITTNNATPGSAFLL